MAKGSVLREVEVQALLIDSRDNVHVMLLKDRHSSKAMPICIGEAEAASIALELQGRSFPRPLPQDLMKQLLSALGGALERVVISDIKEETYCATLHLNTPSGEVKELDARPSDSVALALRTNSPIYIVEEVFRQSAVELSFTEEDKFHNFVDLELKLSDFKRHME